MKQNKKIEEVAEQSYRTIVKLLIKYHQDLEVNVFEENGKIIIEPRANYADCGKLIGKQRATQDSISNLLMLAGDKHGEKFKLSKLLPARTGTSEESIPFTPDKNWKPDSVEQSLEEILDLFLSHDYDFDLRHEGDETHIHIKISKDEKLILAVGQIAFSLSKIFHAIGRSQGRKIYITASSDA